MIRIYACLAAVILIIGSMIYVDHRGYERGKLECQAQRAVQADKAQTAIDLRDQRSAENNASMIDWLAANIQPIQAKADDSAATVIVKYRDRIVRVGDDSCSRPPSVQHDLDAARARANGTGTALQAKPDAAHSAGATAAVAR